MAKDDRIKIIAAVPIPYGKLVRTPAGAVRSEENSVMVTTQHGDKYVCHKNDVVKKYHLLDVPDRELIPKVEVKEHKPPTINERNDEKLAKKKAAREKKGTEAKESAKKGGGFNPVDLDEGEE